MGLREYLLSKISEDTKQEIIKEAIARFIENNPEYVAEQLRKVASHPKAKYIMADIYFGVVVRNLSEEDLEQYRPEIEKQYRVAIKKQKKEK